MPQSAYRYSLSLIRQTSNPLLCWRSRNRGTILAAVGKCKSFPANQDWASQHACCPPFENPEWAPSQPAAPARTGTRQGCALLQRNVPAAATSAEVLFSAISQNEENGDEWLHRPVRSDRAPSGANLVRLRLLYSSPELKPASYNALLLSFALSAST